MISIMSCGSHESPVYLRSDYVVFVGWTKVETVDSLVRKAGYVGPITESMRRKFRITRYQSSLYTMHYSEYQAYVKRIRGAIPLRTVKC